MVQSRLSARSAPHAAPPSFLTITMAQGVIMAERAWPLIIAAAGPLVVYLAMALLGAWTTLPLAAHWALLVILCAAMGASAWRASVVLTQVQAGTDYDASPRKTRDNASRFGTRRMRIFASRLTAKDRLEKDGAVRHEALKSLTDTPFEEVRSPRQEALWRAHQDRMTNEARKARLGRPRTLVSVIDPLGLRYAGIGLLVLTLVIAGDQRLDRLAGAFHPTDPGFREGGVADLWIEPPAYTGRAPIYLLRADDGLDGMQDQVTAPVGSRIVMQPRRNKRLRLEMRTRNDRLRATREDEKASSRQVLTLTSSGLLRLSGGGLESGWPIAVTPDRPPFLRISEPPTTTRDGKLALSLDIIDDYGLTDATVRMQLDSTQPRPLDAPAFDGASKETVREISLHPPRGLTGTRQFDVDIESDPWAGLVVTLSVVGEDAIGQRGETDTVRVELPKRFFSNALARTVIEQRQTLAVAPSQWRRAAFAFNGVTLAPEAFYDDASEYLLLRTAQKRIANKAGDNYDETVEEFWPLALQLENKVLSDARARLEAAQQALRDAIAQGASDQDLERLTENLRTAMQEYLQALAQNADGEGQQRQQQGATQSLSLEDLNRMLDSVRDLSQSGARGAAQQALNDLQNLLNNLQLSGQSGQDQQGQGQGGEAQTGQGQGGAAGQAADLISRQRDIANDTFARRGDPEARGADLANRERELAGDLAEMIEELRSDQDASQNNTSETAPNGDPGERNGQGGETGDADGQSDIANAKRDADRALNSALSDMRIAESALDGDNFRAAGAAMERAIRNLREGAEALARADAAQSGGQQAGQGGRQGQGRPQQAQGGSQGGRYDPLGRPIGRPNAGDVDVPGLSEGDRARAVLEELRRRLSTGERTEEEIQYLERLLERF